MSSPKRHSSSYGSTRLDDAHPFGVLWLDSLFQEIFLPNGAWQKVALKISSVLADRIRKQFDRANRKQMIFELMGQEFVQIYFPEEMYDPDTVTLPAISPEERRKLHVDAYNWLQKQLLQVTSELGCERPGHHTRSAPSTEMAEFLQFARFLAARNLDRHLYLQEKEILRAWKDYQWQQKETKDKEKEERHKARIKQEYGRITGLGPAPQSILRGLSTPRTDTAMPRTNDPTPYIERPPGTAVSIFTTASESSSKTTANIKGAMYGATEDPPTFWGMQSNSIGRSVVAILKRDPRRYAEVAARLHGRQLPATLRAYLWLDVLLRADRDRLNDINTEKIVRERFGKALSRGISNLKVKRATHSPISGLIDNAVIELYDVTPAMRIYLEQDDHMKEAAKALNILYVYDRTYEPYLIYWLLPLQVAFQDFSGPAEHVYDLAMYLDLLNKSCFPKWPRIFAIAERVMSRLDGADRELHDHLMKVSSTNVNIDPKEFLVQLIHQEKTKAQALLAIDPASPSSHQVSKDLLADPRIFLRKWVGEGFASVLDTQAVIYVWDQCFLQRWAPSVLEDVCLAVLLLLRDKFMETQEYRDMRRVFLREPCRLYTMDMQHAWVHIQGQGDLNKVPRMNRQVSSSRPATAVPIEPRSVSPVDTGVPSPVEPTQYTATQPHSSPQPSVLSLKPLPPIGIKNLRVKLDLSPQVMDDQDLLASSIAIQCSVYFGTVRLASQTSRINAQMSGPTTDRYGARTLSMSFPGERFVFDGLDTSQYDLEQEMGGYPYAILQVTMATDVKETSIGWSRLRLFHHQPQGWSRSGSPWVLQSGNNWYTLHSGQASEPDPRQASEPSRDTARPPPDTALVGSSSELGVFVFDPYNEPRTPSPTPVPSREPTLPVSQIPEPSVTPNPKPDTPTLPGVQDTFMLYIDGVENIPDNATITKVTGRLIKTGSLTGLEDILAPPELASVARCPTSRYQMLINESKALADKEMIILMRVYTINRISGALEVIGSCMCDVFNQQTGKVHVGGHQRVLHYGMPDLSRGLQALNPTSLDTAPRVPGCTIYYRLVTYSETYTAPPAFTLEYYPLDDRKFNESELRVIDSFRDDRNHPATVADMAEKVQTGLSVTDPVDDTSQWIMEQLDQKKHLVNQSAGYLPLGAMVQYRLDKGVSVYISRAAGLPEGLYTECFAQVYPGEGTKGLQVTPEGYGGDEEKFVTLKTDLDSQQVSPKWKDEVKMLHPHCDPHTVLVIQLFGLPIKYSATEDHQRAGEVTDLSGADLELREEHNIAWGTVPLFDQNYTMTGEHRVPLFRGRPHPDVIKQFSNQPVEGVLSSLPEDSKMGAASLTVSVWDGHFNEGELLEPLKSQHRLLEAMGNKDQYLQADRDTQGPKLSQYILDGLSPADKAQGPNSQVYQAEKQLFAGLMEKAFLALMENALLEAGYGPL